jgi:hypothetical protein
VTLLLVALLSSQGLAPLRKSDLVRLLSTATITQQEVAELVRANCVTFEPTERDRQDLRRLGAELPLLAAVDECARRQAARAAPKPPPAAPPSPPPAPPGAIRMSAERSAFITGAGQRGLAGARLPRVLVFEARDSANAPIAGQPVELVAVNARVEPAVVVTDAGGRLEVGVTLGPHAGYATVIAAMGVVEKQAAFAVAAGPAVHLAVACGPGGKGLAVRFAIRPDTVVPLRVTAQDAYGNLAPLSGLRAAVADARIVRVLRIAEDSGAGTVALKPDQAGTTSLAVIANGLRQYLTVTVPPRLAPGSIDCP